MRNSLAHLLYQARVIEERGGDCLYPLYLGGLDSLDRGDVYSSGSLSGGDSRSVDRAPILSS